VLLATESDSAGRVYHGKVMTNIYLQFIVRPDACNANGLPLVLSFRNTYSRFAPAIFEPFIDVYRVKSYIFMMTVITL
jgi:hypothetical protein